MNAKYAVRVYRDEAKQFRWRILSKANGNNVGNGSEGYERLGAALSMVNALFEPQLDSGSIELQFTTEVTPAGKKWVDKHWEYLEFVSVEGN